MKSEQVHLLLIVCLIAAVACWFGFKAGTYYGSNKELSKLIKKGGGIDGDFTLGTAR